MTGASVGEWRVESSRVSAPGDGQLYNPHGRCVATGEVAALRDLAAARARIAELEEALRDIYRNAEKMSGWWSRDRARAALGDPDAR